MQVVPSQIDAVKVYHRGATVTRLLTVPVGDGGLPERIEVRELPLALIDATVRVRVTGSDATVVATDVHIGLHAIERGDEVPDVDEEALKEVSRELFVLRRELQQLQLESALLEEIGVPERPEPEEGKPPTLSPMAARLALERFADEAIARRWTEVRALRNQIEVLQEREADLRDTLRRASDAGVAHAHELRKTAVITLRVEAGSPTASTLQLDYFIPGARWAPSYQCQLSADGDRAELQLRAVLAQRSGEDWRGVKLQLSTADPLQWTELPTLTSIRIGKAQPQLPARRGFREAPRGAEVLYADADRDRARASRLLPDTRAQTSPSPTVPQLEALERHEYYGASAAAVGGMAMEYDAEEADEVAAPMEAMSGRAGGGGSRGAPAPPPAAPRRRMAKERKKGGPRPGRAEAAAVEPEPAMAEAAMPRFGQLRLGSPWTPSQRGKLMPASTRDAYRQTLGRAVRVDVLAVVAQAQQAAAAVGRRAMPEGTIDVRQAAGRFDYTYTADDRIDVGSDGELHSVSLGTRQADARVTYVVVPREDTNVFRIARITNPLDAPLLPGPTDVYVGGDYVLSTSLPVVAPSGAFKLGLGVEQAIKCARNTRFSEARSGTRVVAMTELHHDVEISLANRLSRPIECEVRERIPQPAEDAEVVVEEERVDPAWETFERQTRGPMLAGGRRWKVTVPAGTEQQLSARYVVKIYANNELVGGNRREA
jgi:hypothetical protein